MALERVRGSWQSGAGARAFAIAVSLAGAACASRVLQYENEQALKSNAEYEKKVVIKELPAEPVVTESNTALLAPVDTAAPPPTIRAPPKAPPPKPKAKEVKMKPAEQRQPDIEDSEGFAGRRPVVDPYRVGERVTLALTYFNMTAGYLDLEVLPFAEVNGKLAYSFRAKARSNAIFSRFYAVDDTAVTYVDYESLLPINFEITVRESKQLADIKSFFDFKKLKGNYWEKRVSKSKGERNKSIEWDIKPYSQNVISAIFYLRNFTLSPGKKLAFQVADEGKNILFTAEVLRKERLSTDIGELDTLVVKPKFEVDGVFKPVGDILFWLTDDDRKLLVRIESKIKIGTIIGKVKSIEPGR